MSAFFYSTCGVAILSTLMAMLSRHAVHALLYFVLSLLGLSLALFDLGAPFAAALELIIYAGAIMVLFVFVVMLLNPTRDLSRKNLLFPSVLFASLMLELIFLSPKPSNLAVSQNISAYQVMATLFREYGTLVELVSFLLLAGLIAAYRIAKK